MRPRSSCSSRSRPTNAVKGVDRIVGSADKMVGDVGKQANDLLAKANALVDQVNAIAGKIRTRQNWIGGNDYNPCRADFHRAFSMGRVRGPARSRRNPKALKDLDLITKTSETGPFRPAGVLRWRRPGGRRARSD